MNMILIDELVRYHLEHYDCFIPIFRKHVLDKFTLDCQLADSLACLTVIVPKDGWFGAVMLADRIGQLGFTFTSTQTGALNKMRQHRYIKSNRDNHLNLTNT